ncbi:class I SAM-dependent methyltransferase [bacterium]|nr:class I SAM-dependent methyltransferase [bacterium]
MTPVSLEEFAAHYAEALHVVRDAFSEEMQTEMARHNVGWTPGRTDFMVYLEHSVDRYYRAYRVIAANPNAKSVVDVGGFWGLFPMVLVKCGYEVTMTEKLDYYGRAFDALFASIRAHGVTILDYDPFDDEPDPAWRFDFVSMMAILEHYPHSLRRFMAHIKTMAAPGGRVFIEVPNIAYYHKRMALLKGKTPLTPIRDIYLSASPFIGHHHEFTRAELRDLAELAGLRIVAEDSYNYSMPAGFSFAFWRERKLGYLLEKLFYFLWEDSKETLTMTCRADEGARIDASNVRTFG